MLLPLLAVALVQEPPEVVVESDNVQITESCRVRVNAGAIIDADNNGIIQISGDNITVDFQNTRLRGAPGRANPDEYTGIGIHITGSKVTIRNVWLSGFKVAVHATNADGLTIDNVELKDNFRQRLLSTPEAENTADWLSPHHNDNNEWAKRYGAGIYIEDSADVTVRNVTARQGQNGIVLDRADGAKVYDNDCSFLSGWGLAMWRSSGCIITRNAFDFCIRGYSHGVYSRGQDSAGILMFEQCTNNVIAENSATHGGDGVFAFSGLEAIGEGTEPNEPTWYEKRGSVGNVFLDNEFSYAAAHGLESTFGFDTVIIGNRFAGNAYCGVWAGYSSDSVIAENTFTDNGRMPHGLERGGVNIEHGSDNRIVSNQFENNACGVHLWWDDDTKLLDLPWTKQNGAAAANNLIVRNTFDSDDLAVHLRDTTGTIFTPNTFRRVGEKVLRENAHPNRGSAPAGSLRFEKPAVEIYGDNTPVGARRKLADRQSIIMTEWGPHDWSTPRYARLPQDVDDNGRARLTYQYLPALLSELYQPPNSSYNYDSKSVEVTRLKLSDDEPFKKSFQFTALKPGVHPISFQWGMDKNEMNDLSALLIWNEWSVRQFKSAADPREDYDRWKRAGERTRPITLASLDFPFGGEGPDRRIGSDHFGIIATTTLPVPAGTWRLDTVSDDGIRVYIDDELVIDDWTHRIATPLAHEFTLDRQREVNIRVEYFELTGSASLSVKLDLAK